MDQQEPSPEFIAPRPIIVSSASLKSQGAMDSSARLVIVSSAMVKPQGRLNDSTSASHRTLNTRPIVVSTPTGGAYNPRAHAPRPSVVSSQTGEACDYRAQAPRPIIVSSQSRGAWDHRAQALRQSRPEAVSRTNQSLDYGVAGYYTTSFEFEALKAEPHFQSPQRSPWDVENAIRTPGGPTMLNRRANFGRDEGGKVQERSWGQGRSNGNKSPNSQMTNADKTKHKHQDKKPPWHYDWRRGRDQSLDKSPANASASKGANPPHGLRSADTSEALPGPWDSSKRALRNWAVPRIEARIAINNQTRHEEEVGSGADTDTRTLG